MSAMRKAGMLEFVAGTRRGSVLAHRPEQGSAESGLVGLCGSFSSEQGSAQFGFVELCGSFIKNEPQSLWESRLFATRSGEPWTSRERRIPGNYFEFQRALPLVRKASILGAVVEQP